MSETPEAASAFSRQLFSGDCRFVAGAANFDALPESTLPEVAFVGRSNVGKSSLINALTGRAKLARVSNTPGRTRQINLFQLQNSLMLADLPGYGFARISKQQAAEWENLITRYLRVRKNLRRVLLLVDARRGLMFSDRAVMALLDDAGASYQLVLTKGDAVKPNEIAPVADAAGAELQAHPAALSAVLVTSAKQASGQLELRAALTELAAA